MSQNAKTKDLVIVVPSAQPGRDLLQTEIEPGTTARDVLLHHNLKGYALVPHGGTVHLVGNAILWHQVESGGKLRATPIAEVGSY